MGTFLFDQVIFGPVRSRRLGISLGINLLPTGSKVCNFSCVYCECGWTPNPENQDKGLPSREAISYHLDFKLSQMKQAGLKLNAITYAGNGEPTLHPEFVGIIDDTIELRNKYFPEVKIAVLSNATMIHDVTIFEALKKVEQNILKLDSAIDDTFQALNKPTANIKPETIIENLAKYNGDMILQTMFVKGSVDGKLIDNTTDVELDAWLGAIKKIAPKSVMIYTFARDTPCDGLQKVSEKELMVIAKMVEDLGIEVSVSG